MSQNTIENIKRMSFIGFLSLFVFIVYIYNLSFYNESANKIVQHFGRKDSLIQAEVHAIPDDSYQIKKLKTQYNIIQETKEPYILIAQTYSSNGYAFTMVFALISVLTGVFAFLIVKKGWDNTQSFYLRAGFLVLFFFSTLAGVIQAVSDTKENTKKNMERYYFYNGLQLDIHDYIRDNQGFIKRKEYEKVDSFLSSIKNLMKNNPDIYFNIDIDKVPKSINPLPE